jgi:hypothetical protein
VFIIMCRCLAACCSGKWTFPILAQMFGCRKKMSAIAILDYSGAEAIYNHMETLAQQGRLAWLQHSGSTAAVAGGSEAAQAALSESLPLGPLAQVRNQPASYLRLACVGLSSENLCRDRLQRCSASGRRFPLGQQSESWDLFSE